MSGKTAQLQIRVTPDQKARLKALARQAGRSVTDYVLAKALPNEGAHVARLIDAMRDETQRSFALAELHDWLVRASPSEFVSVGEVMDVSGLDPLWQNYVAALVEQAAVRKSVPVPTWVTMVVPLEHPWFAVPYASLRPHLLKSAPVQFKRRNLFVDTGLGARV